MQKLASYAEAQATNYPHQTIVVVAKDREGKPNPATIGRVMSASDDPPMVAFAVNKTCYTAETITHTRMFTIAFPSATMKDAVVLFGTESGRTVDKLEKTACATQPASEIEGVLLSDAVANFECELESYMPAGDHMIYVGRVAVVHIHESPQERLFITGPDYQLGGVKL